MKNINIEKLIEEIIKFLPAVPPFNMFGAKETINNDKKK